MLLNSSKGFYNPVLIAVIVFSIVVGVYLVSQRTDITPSAAEDSQGVGLDPSMEKNDWRSIPGDKIANWYDYSVVHSGARSFRASTGEETTIQTDATLKANTTYTWVGFIKTLNNNLRKTFLFILTPPGSQGGEKTQQVRYQDGRVFISHDLPQGTNDWQLITASFTTGQAGRADLLAGVPQIPAVNGTVWFDDVYLYEGDRNVALTKVPFQTCAKLGGTCVNSTNKSEDGKTCATSLNAGPVSDCSGEYAYCFVTNSCALPSASPSLSPSPSPSSTLKKPGDTNNDGLVDIFDFNTVVSNFGKTNDPNTIADLDDDNDVDIFDYNMVIVNYGK